MQQQVVRSASNAEARLLRNRAAQLLERKAAPTASYPDRVVDWPVSSLASRVFVGGIQIPDAEDGFIDAQLLDDFLAQHCSSGAGVWALGAEDKGMFVGYPPFAGVRNWILGTLILSPSVVLSLTTDVVVIADEQLRYSVIGADKERIAWLDDAFGGSKGFLEKLTREIDRGEIGFGQEDIVWAKQFLRAWCFGQ